MKYLFLGGYYDGEWVDVSDPCYYNNYYEMPIPPFPEPTIVSLKLKDFDSHPEYQMLERERYRLERIRTVTKTYSIFLLDSLTSDDMFSMLMNNYKKV